MRSTMLGPRGDVWSKYRERTISAEWPSAPRRSFVLPLSRGSRFCARIWLCRQTMATRTASRFAGVGTTSAFGHEASALARAAWRARTAFVPLATWAWTTRASACFGVAWEAAGKARARRAAVTMSFLRGTGTLPSRATNDESDGPADPDVPVTTRSLRQL